MSTLLILGFGFVAVLFLQVLFVWVSARIARIPGASFLRSCLATLVLFLVNILLLVAFSLIRPESLQAALALLAGEIVVSLLSTWIVLAATLSSSFPRAMLASVPLLALSMSLGMGLIYGLKGFVLEAFVSPTNSMAPTICGGHKLGKCPNCGQNVVVRYYVVPTEPEEMRPRQGDSQMSICAGCRQIHFVKAWDESLQAETRIICNKLLSPKRWDVIVYRYPREPKLLYVSRLVGFPGEEVMIKEGSVWINGVKQEPPEGLRGLFYITEEELMDVVRNRDRDGRLQIEANQAAAEERVQLSPDGYFVLGDFTAAASDSRDWGEVPTGNLVGVVDLIYWPPSRWRVLR